MSCIQTSVPCCGKSIKAVGADQDKPRDLTDLKTSVCVWHLVSNVGRLRAQNYRVRPIYWKIIKTLWYYTYIFWKVKRVPKIIFLRCGAWTNCESDVIVELSNWEYNEFMHRRLDTKFFMLNFDCALRSTLIKKSVGKEISRREEGRCSQSHSCWKDQLYRNTDGWRVHFQRDPKKVRSYGVMRLYLRVIGIKPIKDIMSSVTKLKRWEDESSRIIFTNV